MTANRPHLDQRDRLIVAIDLDAFYLSVERLLNPALNGVPVGVVQKSILATASYEARALGVGKLMSVRRAKEICPHLVLVNGEDLTKYRSFSKRVRDLVNGCLGTEEGVEKLGLDEVFLDVSELVRAHLAAAIIEGHGEPDYAARPTHRHHANGRIYFSVPPTISDETGEVVRRGFWYNAATFAGHVLPSSGVPSPSSPSTTARLESLQVGSHFCAFVREEIRNRIGLTTSAGLGYSKQIAKLVGTENKPNDQTTFLDYDLAALQAYLSPMDLRRLNGYGSKIVGEIASELARHGIEFSRETTSETLHACSITVEQTRTALSHQVFVKLFGDRLGDRLWGLLHAIDDDPVHPTPPFPKQISVEDSYADNPRRQLLLISQQMEEILVDLLTRLEEELLGVLPSSTASGSWLRFPTRISLALRRAWDSPHGRDSKSIPFPRFLFDTKTTREDRAARFMRLAGQYLLRDVLAVSRNPKEGLNDLVFDVYVINVSATNLSLHAPPPSIHDAWLKAQEHSQKKEGTNVIDMEVLNALPDDLRQEMMVAYGVKDIPQPRLGVAHEAWDDSTMGDKDVGILDREDSENNDITSGRCVICGMEVYPFAVVAHQRWHDGNES